MPMNWKALIDLVGPVAGTLAQGDPMSKAAFLKGYQDADAQRRELQQHQAEIDRRNNATGADYLLKVGEHAQTFDDPVALSQFLSLADEAGAHARYTKPGDLKNRFTVPATKIAEKRLKELNDQLGQLGQSGYDLDQLAQSGAHLQLKDGAQMPIATAMELVRSRPLDASGAPIARPKRGDVAAPTDYSRFLARFAKDKGKTVDQLTSADELEARKTFNTIDDKAPKGPAAASADAQFNDLVDLWKEGHPGQEPTASVRTQLRAKANTVNDKPASGFGGAGGNSALDPDGIDYAATEYRVTGRMPALGIGNGTARAAIVNTAAKQAKTLGQSAAAAIQKQAAYKADGSALTKMRTMSSAAEAFETKALQQADIVDEYSQKVGRTQYPIINDALLAGKARVLGDANTQLLYNALSTFTTEYAKIMEGSTGSAAGSSESARAAATRLISASLNKGTLAQTLDLMRREMRLTINGYDATIAHITQRMGGAPAADPAPTNRVYYDANGNPVKR